MRRWQRFGLAGLLAAAALLLTPRRAGERREAGERPVERSNAE